MRLSQPVSGLVTVGNFHSKRRIVRCATSADHRHEVGRLRRSPVHLRGLAVRHLS